ncbi:MAG TPA: aldehyde ferredoxin oxidoreductase N-terminal domain-containing protein, partial [Methanocella sp.]|nr:aldehyde ferredoxin oxidoreductase N-terminal domain-containing protein [Methanocella sp.]
MKGLCGKLIRVNLSDGGIDIEPIDEGVARKYPGGKALAAYYAFKEIKMGTDPLG